MFFQTVSMSVSVFTLTAVSYDRYQGKTIFFYFCWNFHFSAICRPLSALKYKKRRIFILLIIIWSLSILLSLPELFILEAVPFLSDETLFPCVDKVLLYNKIDYFLDKLCSPGPGVGSDRMYSKSGKYARLHLYCCEGRLQFLSRKSFYYSFAGCYAVLCSCSDNGPPLQEHHQNIEKHKYPG